MSIIHGTAIIRDGQIIPAGPINLPDGTEIQLTTGVESDDPDAGWDNTPEGIAAWLAWYDSLQPLIVSDEEQAAADAWLKQCSEYEWEKMRRDAKDMFP